MQSSKAVSGMSNIECRAFPKFTNNKSLLHGKACHVIEPYDNNEVISIFILKIDDGFFVKILDKDGVHMELDALDKYEKIKTSLTDSLIIAMNIQKLVGIKQSQLFFAITKDGPVLVDMFDGTKFASPGMISDIYGKKLKIQLTRSIEKFDQDKDYNAIIKPSIACYDNNEPVYIKS